MTEERALVRVAGLTLRRRGAVVLDGVSCEVFPGMLMVLYGPSGAGKSTLLAVLAGILGFDAGVVETCGQDETGLVLQEGGLFPNLTVGENLRAVGMIRGMEVRTLQRGLERAAVEWRLDGVWRERVRRLPWGVQRKLALACALLSGPRLLLVDDVLYRGDPKSTTLILGHVQAYVAAGGACVWATAHAAEAADLASRGPARMGLLEGGRLTVCERGQDWRGALEALGGAAVCPVVRP